MIQPKQIKKVVCYCRVSTQEQVKGVSLDVQRQSLLDEAARNGWQVVEVIEDAGISGKRFSSRPGIQKAISLIEAGEADTLLAVRVDRLGRKSLVVHQVVEKILAAGGVVKTQELQFDRTPSGLILLGVFGGLAESEHLAIRERSVSARQELARRNIQTATRAPFGYKIIVHDDVVRGDYPAEMLGQYVHQEPQATIARQLFSDYAGGKSLPALTRWLNETGVPTPHGGALWRVSSVRCILVNEIYVGRGAFGRTTATFDEARLKEINPTTNKPFIRPDVRRVSDPEKIIPITAPPLITEDTWHRIQARLAMNKAAAGGNPNRTHALSGLLRCKHCGGAMNRKVGGDGAAYYQCRARARSKENTGRAVCAPDSFRQARMETATMRAVEAAATHPEWVEAAVEDYQKKRPEVTPEDTRRELSALDKALQDLSNEEAAAVQGQIAGIRAGASPDAYAAVFADLAARRKDMESRRGALAQAFRQKTSRGAGAEARRPKTEEAHAAALRDLHTALQNPFLTGAERRGLLARVVQKVTGEKDGANVTFLPGLIGDTLHETTVYCRPVLSR